MESINDILKKVSPKGEGGSYPEAIDGGSGRMPLSGYRIYKNDDGSASYGYESYFPCYDGYDSDYMDIGEAPSYNEAVLRCYIDKLSNEMELLRDDIKLRDTRIGELNFLLELNRRGK